MTTTADSYRPADWAVIGMSGAICIVALMSLLYALPWRRSWRRSDSLNMLWPTRCFLMIFVAALAAVQVARLYSLLWNPGSPISSEKATDWTVQGWMCRIYISASLGVLAPMCFWLAVFSIESGRHGLQQLMGKKPLPGWEISEPTILPSNNRIFMLSLLCTLPVAILQSVVAFVGVWASTGDKSPEEDPRSVMGYFFATFWSGDDSECNSSSNGSNRECILCVFPAASAIIYVAFSFVVLLALWIASWNLASHSLNRSVKKRLRRFVAMFSVLSILGCGAMGASVAWGPFSWVNQSLWLGYFASIIALSLLLIIDIVIWPVRAVHVAAEAMNVSTYFGNNGNLTSDQLEHPVPSAPPMAFEMNGHQNSNRIGLQQGIQYRNNGRTNPSLSYVGVGGLAQTAIQGSSEDANSHPFALDSPSDSANINSSPHNSPHAPRDDLVMYPAAAAAMLDPSGLYDDKETDLVANSPPSNQYSGSSNVFAFSGPSAKSTTMKNSDHSKIETPTKTIISPKLASTMHRRNASLQGLRSNTYSPWHRVGGFLPFYTAGGTERSSTWGAGQVT